MNLSCLKIIGLKNQYYYNLVYNSVELYAKNIGLIYFKKEIDNNIVQEYELANIYDRGPFENKFQAIMPENVKIE